MDKQQPENKQTNVPSEQPQTENVSNPSASASSGTEGLRSPFELAQTYQAQNAAENQQTLTTDSFTLQNAPGYEMWMGDPETYSYTVEELPRCSVSELGYYAVDGFQGALGGVGKGIEELTETSALLVNWGLHLGGINYSLPTDYDFVPNILKPKTWLGRLTQASVSFATKSYVLGAVGGRFTKASSLAQSVVDDAALKTSVVTKLPYKVVSPVMNSVAKGFFVDLTRNPRDAIRFSDYFAQCDSPFLNNIITQSLATNPTNPDELNERVKNACEGIVTNAMAGLIGVFAKQQWYKMHNKIWPKSLDADRLRYAEQVRQECEDYVTSGKVPEYGNPKVKPGRKDVREKLEKEAFYTPKSGKVDNILIPNADKKDTLLNRDYMTPTAARATKELDDLMRENIMARANELENGGEWKIDATSIKKQAKAWVDRLSPLEVTEAAPELEEAAVSATNEAMKKQINLAALYQLRVAPDIYSTYAKIITAQQNGTVTPDMIKELAGTLANGVKTGSCLYRVRARFGALLASLKNVSNYQAQVSDVKTTLLDMSDDEIKATFDALDPEIVVKLAGTMNAISEAGNSTEAMAWLMKASQEIVNGNTESLMQSIGKNLTDWLYFSRLSGLNTHIRNSVENFVRSGTIDPADTYFTSLAQTGSFEHANGKLAAGLLGSKVGFEKARQAVALTWKYGQPVLESKNSPTLNISASDAGLLKKIQTSMTSDALQAADEFWAQINYSKKVYEALYDMQHSSEWKQAFKGASNAVKEAYATLFVRGHYRDSAIGPGVVARSMTASRILDTKWNIDSKKLLNETTDILMQTEHPEQRFYQWLTATKRLPFIGPLIQPFVRVTYNQTADIAWRHNPIGLLRLLGNPDLTPDDKAKVWGQFATTCIMFTAGAELVAAGKVTGGGPRSGTARAAWLEMGYKPYSYMSDDGTIIPLGNFSAAAPAMLIADMYERFWDVDRDDPEGESIFTTAFNAFTGYMLDKSFVTGLNDFINAVNNLDGGYFIQNNIASMFTPNALTTLRNMTDSSVREQKDKVAGLPTGQIMNRLPGLSYAKPVKYSWLTGDPVEDAFTGGLGEYGGTLRMIQAALLPISKKKNMTEEDKLFLETMTKVKGVSAPKRITSHNVPLDDEDYSEFCKIMGTIKVEGQTLKERVVDLIQSPTWSTLGSNPSGHQLSENKNRAIKRIVDAYKDAAEAKMFELHPAMMEYAVEHYNWEQQHQFDESLPEPVYQKLVSEFE